MAMVHRGVLHSHHIHEMSSKTILTRDAAQKAWQHANAKSTTPNAAIDQTAIDQTAWGNLLLHHNPIQSPVC